MRLRVLGCRILNSLGLLAVLACASATPEAQPLSGQTYLDSTFAGKVDAGGPFATYDDMFEWLDTEKAYPQAILEQFGSELFDPSESMPYYFALGWDSTAWLQTPSGETARLDPIALLKIADYASGYMGFDSTDALNEYSVTWDTENIEFGIWKKTSLRSIAYWVGGILSVLVILVGLSIFRLRTSLQNAEERGRQLAESRRRFADNREAERIRIARDLHDGPLQDLQAVRMRLGMARMAAAKRAETTDADSPLSPANMGVQDDLLRVINEIRGISEGLRPPALAAFGLAAAVRSLMDRHSAAHPEVTIRLDFEEQGDDLAEAVRLALYRMVQEGANNALQHGEPSALTISYFKTSEGGVTLSIVDDGAGFEVPSNLHELEQEGHLGLVGMAERVESIGGTLSISSQPGSTRFVIHLSPEALANPPHFQTA